jgi:hypothetical protein
LRIYSKDICQVAIIEFDALPSLRVSPTSFFSRVALSLSFP